MSDVYENCPVFENDKYLLRFATLEDAEDLTDVYGDNVHCRFSTAIIVTEIIFTILTKRAWKKP